MRQLAAANPRPVIGKTCPPRHLLYVPPATDTKITVWLPAGEISLGRIRVTSVTTVGVARGDVQSQWSRYAHLQDGFCENRLFLVDVFFLNGNLPMNCTTRYLID